MLSGSVFRADSEIVGNKGDAIRQAGLVGGCGWIDVRRRRVQFTKSFVNVSKRVSESRGYNEEVTK